MSFVLFPTDSGETMVSLVVGTNGLQDDAASLSRPGHARKALGICDWLNAGYGQPRPVAWAKHDPARTDVRAPKELSAQFPNFSNVFERYGHVIYAFCVVPPDQHDLASDATAAFLDLFFDEKGVNPLRGSEVDAQRIREDVQRFILPQLTELEVVTALKERRFVIIEGPPGTGKTRLARELLKQRYSGRGTSIQFHPSTTYETFVGGLAPAQDRGEFGLRFEPRPGALMEAAVAAARLSPEEPFLLHIDEINRADLGKVLGEAIYLFESTDGDQREITLPFDFGQGREFRLPSNLHVLGTMNSADRSTAIVDLAIRRRFAFLKMWPDPSVVHSLASPLARTAFTDLLDLFINEAPEQSMSLVPGHSYFLRSDDAEAVRFLRQNLLPLLDEYVEEGLVPGFEESIRTYVQRVSSLKSTLIGDGT